jgi:hypothetical protein
MARSSPNILCLPADTGVGFSLEFPSLEGRTGALFESSQFFPEVKRDSVHDFEREIGVHTQFG